MDDVQRSLGRIEGKLDSLTDAVRQHADQDTRRFDTLFRIVDDHAKDINRAKGAQRALVWAAGGVAGVISLVAGAAQYVLK